MSNRDPLSNPDDTVTRVRVGQSDPMSGQQEMSGAGGQQAMDTAKQKGQEVAGMAQEKGQEAMGAAKQKTDQVAGQVQEKGQQVAGMAQDRADQGIDTAATGLTQAADMLRSQGEQQGGTVGTVASKAAERLDSASQYLQGKDSQQLLDDLEALARRKPVESLLAAAGIGFVLSKVIR